MKEECPVDVLAQLRQLRLDDPRARERRSRKLVEAERPTFVARLVQGQKSTARGGVLRAQLVLKRSVVPVEDRTPLAVEQGRHDADDARCVQHMYCRAGVSGGDADSGGLLVRTRSEERRV